MNSIKTSNFKPSAKDISAQNVLTPQCSCAKCDSISCFAIRSNPPSGKCKCYLCSNSKTCLYNRSLTPNFRQDKSSSAHLIQSKSIEKCLGDQESYFKEHITEETVYSIDTKTNKARIVSQKQSKYSQSSNSKMFNEATMNKDGLRPQVRSVAVTYPRKEINSSTAKLSAQVMNVPYNQFNESFDHSDNSSYKAIKLSTYDIFKRIKEAYKACSCKVCECVTSRFSRKDSCKCKPCDCDDCKGFGRLNKSESSTQLSNTFCPCVRCDRRDCKAITKKRPFACDCSPCDCMQCVEEFTKPCDCKPCQCIECKSISVRNKTIVVAPVGEEHQRNLCQCSPCDCIECGNPSFMHNMSTGIDRHQNCRCESCLNDSCVPDGIDSCNCVRRNQVMRKPIERDTRDYDIHRASIANKNSLNKDKSKHDTIAMFATLTKDYPSLTRNNTANDCEFCRKVKSSLKDVTASHRTGIPKTEIPLSNRDLNLHTIYETSKKLKLGNIEKKLCKCSPCECQICDHGTVKSRKDVDSEEKQTKSCKCDVCACLYCEALSPSNFGAKNEISFSECKCNPCECMDCQNKMTKCNDIVCHCSNCKCESCIEHNNFVKKVVNYNRDDKPISFKTDFSEPSRFLINLDSSNHSLANPNGSVSETRDQKLPKELSVYHVSSLDNIESSGEEYSSNITNEQTSLKQNIQYKNGTIRYNQYKPNSCSIVSKETSFLSDSCAFGHIYFGAQSKSSYFKDSDSTSQSSGKKKPPHLAYKQPSWGSYNSSAFESPNNFPRTTVEKCLNDVLKLNLDKSINLDRFYISSPSKVSSRVLRDDQTKTLSPNLWMCHSEISRRRNVIDDIEKHCMITPNGNNQSNINSKKYDLRKRDDENNYARLIRAFVGDSEFQKKEIETQTLTEETFYDRHNIDYVKAHHTLQEAKAFSLELLKILHKYEKANREFKSMSQTLKLAENRILSKHNAGISNMKIKNCEEKSHFKPENELEKKGVMEKEESKINPLNNKIGPNKISCFLLKDNKNVIFIRNYLENLLNAITDKKYEKTSNCEIERKINKYNNLHNKESLNVNAVKKFNKLIRKVAVIAEENRFKKGNIVDEAIYKTEPSNIETNVNQATELLHYNKQQIKEKVSHHIQEMNRILFDVIEKITEPNVLNIMKPKCAEYEDNVVVEEQKNRFGSRPELGKKNFDTKLTTDKQNSNNTKHYENRTLVEALGGVKDLLNMPQLQCCASKYESSSGCKTNLGLQLSDSSSQTRSMFPYNIKKGAHSMFTTRYQNDPFKIPTLSDLKKLYWKSDFRESKEVNETYLPKINSSVSNCDDLKVCLLCVRRVSDHTVMVKWETPRNVEKVQGYELLVDGRAVQKIFSPSRRMAVITCLPHCEKVLLTVRTIVTPDSLCGHHPTTTIVYRPREHNISRQSHNKRL